MKYKVTKFGYTKMVKGYVTKNGDVCNQEYYDILLFVERPEDYYALSSPEYKDKYVLVIDVKDFSNT